jgi:hypothetical protein
MSKNSTQKGRRRGDRAARLATLVAILASVWVMADASVTAAARPITVKPEVAFVRNIPSHNRVYRASLIPSTASITLDRSLTWALDVHATSGAPVPGAELALDSWMPDDPGAQLERPQVTDLGDGHYRIDGIRFDRRGWWNVKLQISKATVTDSLAFNIVLK